MSKNPPSRPGPANPERRRRRQPADGSVVLPGETAPDLADTSMILHVAERDSLLGGELPDPTIPQSEDEFVFRDPFSADYVEFRKEQAERKRLERIDRQLRADLLAKPYLMEKPAESGALGAAAVWRSLRDILRQESASVMDRSGLEELLMLKRELEARKAIVEAVGTGIGKQLQRLELRISAAREAESAEPAGRARGKKKAG